MDLEQGRLFYQPGDGFLSRPIVLRCVPTGGRLASETPCIALNHI